MNKKLLIAALFLLIPFNSAFAQFTTVQGGTGTTSPSGILYGDGTLHLKTVTPGANCTFTGGVFNCTSGGGAGSGTVSTSTGLVAGQVDFSTGVSTIGNDSTFLFSTTEKRLTTTNASTTAFTVLGPSYLIGTASSSVFSAFRGTAALPAFTFNDDLDTGIYHTTNNNELAFSAGGAQKILIQGTDIITLVQLQGASNGSYLIPNAAGSITAPNYSFNADSNTGLWSRYADSVSFTAGGTEIFRGDIASTSIPVGNFGVGTTSPYRALSISGSGVFAGGDVLASTFTATSSITTPAITISGISGSTQCLHVNSSGLVSGTGSDCGAGGGGTGSGLASTTAAGAWTPGNVAVVYSNGAVYGQSTSTPALPSYITYTGGTLGSFVGGTSGTFSINSLPIANGGTATTTFRDKGVVFYSSTLGTLTQATSTTGFNFDRVTENLGLGVATPLTKLTVSSQPTIQTAISGSIAQFVGLDANPLRITFDTHNNSSTSGTAFMFRRSRGTAATPLADIVDDVLGSLNFRGYGTTAYAAGSTGLISAKAEGTFTDTSMPTAITFDTTPSASVTAAERLRITGAGSVAIGLTNPGSSFEIKATTTAATASAVTVWDSSSAKIYNIADDGTTLVRTPSPATGALTVGTTTTVGTGVFNVDTANSSSAILSVASSTGTVYFAVDNKGHRVTGGTAPTLSSCGTTPSITGDDNGGLITIGSGVPSACTATFALAWTSAPTCTASTDSGTIFSFITSTSVSAVTFGLSGTLGGGKIYYTCQQHS